MSRVVLGCERLLADADLIRGRRVGLITNHSGVDARLQSTADRLHQSDLCTLVALYGPEHGIRGAAQDGEHIAHSTDERTGVPTLQSLRPSAGTGRGHARGRRVNAL